MKKFLTLVASGILIASMSTIAPASAEDGDTPEADGSCPWQWFPIPGVLGCEAQDAPDDK